MLAVSYTHLDVYKRQGQEPGTEADIKEFCTLTYGVKFPMFGKEHVVGPDATPLYRDLKNSTGVEPGWNFHKYLIHKDGKTVESFTSKVKPNDPALITAIEKALACLLDTSRCV